jgi:uncharacterized membrane protein (DUF4010 family)
MLPISDDIVLLLRLLLALAIGLLIGLERGWRAREAADEMRIAGWRSFALLGLLGGLSALLEMQGIGWATSLLLFCITLLLAIAYGFDILLDQHWSITNSLAALITFILGALAMGPYAKQAVAATVMVTIMLALREKMHGMLRRLTPADLHTTLRFSLIALVILPWLPDRNFGPFGVLNPFRLWAMVVLICGLSFAGYIAMRLFGQSRGILVTAAAGGLVSSTAVTLALARIGRDDGAKPNLLAAGIVVACTTMPMRMIILLTVLNKPVLLASGLCLASASITLLICAVVLFRRASASSSTSDIIQNPLNLPGASLVTGAIAILMIMSRAIEANLGDHALIPLGAITGAFDVDAMLVSMATLPAAKVPLNIVRDAILAGAFTNSMMKASIAIALAPMKIARPAAVSILLSVLSSGSVWFLLK